MQLTEADIARFQSKVRNAFALGCHEWVGVRHRRGYGVFAVRRARLLAHRVAYHIAFGPIPAGLCVCHRCDNPRCVRTDHLFLGTVGDNNRDAAMKGRNRSWTAGPEGSAPRLHGESNGRAKLTEADVRELRSLAVAGWSDRRLAERFGIAKNTARYIRIGLRWRCLQPS